MPRRVAEVAAIAAAATMIVLVIAAPVLVAPSERLFGMDIAGRHRDPFTVIAQFGSPVAGSVYFQPLTDLSGAVLARLSSPIAAYNWLVLLSFPLSAAAAFLLARHLGLSGTGATVAAIAYAFSPFHLAHSAYHPHIAQTQWIPLYLLALWRCLDRASPGAVGLLALSIVAVTLSNFYGGMIAAVITPVAVAAYWTATWRPHSGAGRRLVITAGTLILIAAGGIMYVVYAAPAVLSGRAAFAYPRGDLFRYSTTWWSYVVPPVEHPLLGGAARQLWTAFGVGPGLLEHQVSLGWGIIALGLVAAAAWMVHHRQQPSLARIPVIIAVAAAALVCSLSPERSIGGVTVYRPAALLYDLVPMFRAYARFGVVVQLMAALLAGIGVDHLRRLGTTRARIACAILVAAAAVEYAVLPATMWRDVLPTTAHRWAMKQPDAMRVLDCTPLIAESDSVQWLTGNRIRLMSGSIDNCTEPNIAAKLAATGFTHLLLRRDSADARTLAGRPPPDGFALLASFGDAEVFTVTAGKPPVYTASMRGLFRREEDAEWSWRWMENEATWTVVNTGVEPAATLLHLELAAFHVPRKMRVTLDGVGVETIEASPVRRVYEIGPLTIRPGAHEVVFDSIEKPMKAGDVLLDGDRRRLSFALGTWRWTPPREEP